MKSFLKDEPLLLISRLKITDENYSKASYFLSRKCDGKLPILNFHISALVDIEVAKGSKDMKEVIFQIRQHVQSLESLNIKNKDWDLISANILSSRTYQSFLR